jgi:hypothetical protein
MRAIMVLDVHLRTRFAPIALAIVAIAASTLIVVPAGTPQEIVKRLNDELVRIVRSPDIIRSRNGGAAFAVAAS